MKMLPLSVLSLNIWDLPVPLPGVNRRWCRRQLLERAPGLSADLVLLQEAFRPRFKSRILGAFAGFHADHYAHRRRRWCGLTLDQSGGLLTLSRWPILATRYFRARTFPGMKADERVGAKGCLLTTVATPAGPLVIGNVHLYAGAGARAARGRALQVRHLLQRIPRNDELPLLLGGDFNMAPESEWVDRGATGFDLLRDAALHEVANGDSRGLATVAPSRNRYARYWPGRRADRRVTHLFYRGPGLRRAASRPAVCLEDPPLSDHFGFLAGFELEELPQTRHGSQPLADPAGFPAVIAA